MSLSRHQLERADLTVTIEQGRRVEHDLFQENSRGIRTMGELLKARVFGATEYAMSLRKRMTQYVQGGGVRLAPTGALSATRPPEPHPDLDCEAAPRRAWLEYTPEPLIGRLKVPTRYRKDESDR